MLGQQIWKIEVLQFPKTFIPTRQHNREVSHPQTRHGVTNERFKNVVAAKEKVLISNF